MTTPAEKVALDVIFAALDAVTADETKKLAMVFGLAVYLCRKNGIGRQLSNGILADRWDEYSETFDDA
jgi:hypothetical protein